MDSIVEVEGLRKAYDDGTEALKGIDLSIRRGEILAMLGPNGAGKTTLISCICGMAQPTSGTITVGGYDALAEFRKARAMIGLVPQEISLEPFETVWNTVSFTRGLFGRPRDDARLEKVLRDLSLWEKRNSKNQALSGGMKRRVLIAKALAHDPEVLFLDEPTAGVDVELRKEMWDVVHQLREAGTTIILTTHYIEEAEAMADRIGVIAHGEILLMEDKSTLMQRLGQKELRIELAEPCERIPESLSGYDLARAEDGRVLVYTYHASEERTGITRLLTELSQAGLQMTDLSTQQSSLEDIFVDLVREDERRHDEGAPRQEAAQ